MLLLDNTLKKSYTMITKGTATSGQPFWVIVLKRTVTGQGGGSSFTFRNPKRERKPKQMECKSNRHDSHLLSEARAEPPAVVCSALLLTEAARIEYHIIRQIARMHCTAEKLCGAFLLKKL